MAFFLIVPSVMIVSVLFVHALANRLGLRIYYPTLIAVAVVSVMVNLFAATITPAIGREYLIKLGLMILATSFLLTLANRFLLKRQQAEEKRFHEEVKAAYEAEKQNEFKVAEEKISPIDKFKWGDEDILSDTTPAYNEISAVLDEKTDEIKSSNELDETQDDIKSSNELNETHDDIKSSNELNETQDDIKSSNEPDETTDEVKSFSKRDETTDEVKSFSKRDETTDEVKSSIEPGKELMENPNLPENFPLENIFKPLPEIKPEEADKPIKLEEKPPEEDFPLEEVFKPLSDVKPEEIKHFETPAEKVFEPAELFPLQEVFRPLSTLNLDKLEEITREEKNQPHEEETNLEEKIDTLDDLLDKAYNERDKGNIWQAIETYKKALERYRNDEYAPFVAIDLGNIYKDQALYSNAIKIYEEALTLPAVERNSETKKEFLSTLEYLRVVHAVLVKHRALSTPFNKLSKEILKDIDTEFKKVQY